MRVAGGHRGTILKTKLPLGDDVSCNVSFQLDLFWSPECIRKHFLGRLRGLRWQTLPILSLSIDWNFKGVLTHQVVIHAKVFKFIFATQHLGRITEREGESDRIVNHPFRTIFQIHMQNGMFDQTASAPKQKTVARPQSNDLFLIFVMVLVSKGTRGSNTKIHNGMVRSSVILIDISMPDQPIRVGVHVENHMCAIHFGHGRVGMACHFDCSIAVTDHKRGESGGAIVDSSSPGLARVEISRGCEKPIFTFCTHSHRRLSQFLALFVIHEAVDQYQPWFESLHAR